MIVAKPVIDNQYWILKQDDEKIGNVQAVDGGFALTIRNKVAKFKTIRMLRRQSKSWFAAGWYSIKQHRSWKVLQNPKLIVLERYTYQGPFYTEEQANASL